MGRKHVLQTCWYFFYKIRNLRSTQFPRSFSSSYPRTWQWLEPITSSKCSFLKLQVLSNSSLNSCLCSLLNSPSHDPISHVTWCYWKEKWHNYYVMMHTHFSLVTTSFTWSHWFRSLFFAVVLVFEKNSLNWFLSSFLEMIPWFVAFLFQYSVTWLKQFVLFCFKNSFVFYLLHILTPQMDQSLVSAGIKKPYAFAFHKRSHKGKPVIPSSKFDYPEDSINSLFTRINVRVEDKESKPNEDHQRHNSRWSFKEYSNRRFRISIPEETINTGSNWTQLKVFRENVEVGFVLHQSLALSVCELKPFIQKLPEIFKKSLQIEPTEVTAKLLIDETLFQPNAVEEKQSSMCSRNWVRLPD